MKNGNYCPTCGERHLDQDLVGICYECFADRLDNDPAQQDMVIILVKFDFGVVLECLQTATAYGIAHWACNAKLKTLTSENIDITIDEFDGYDESIIETHNINIDLIRRALVLMAEKSPKKFAKLLADQADATIGDILIQYAVFGEITYG